MNNICPPKVKRNVRQKPIRGGSFKGLAEQLMDGDPDSVVWTGGLTVA